jgi:hypothetical protein
MPPATMPPGPPGPPGPPRKARASAPPEDAAVDAPEGHGAEVRHLLAEELRRDEPFENWHGIEPENLRDHLVRPYPITLSRDDGPRQVWVVLEERATRDSGHVVAYDLGARAFVVASRHLETYEWTADAPTLAAALTAM